ncbi:raffinose/stachyose/melibiose transport system substrate-binding protein [Paenibacillus sp. DS2015]|uniref:ABC transporter substrate-binding protein n=1 Tax=Paenibacillus sp. DS2015 TaxID=3373917 RepID=UPI003D1A3D3C
MRRRLKNWSWIVIYVVLLIVTVVVISQGNPDNPIEEDSTEKVTLTFRHFWTKEHDRPMLKIIEDVIHTYQESHPNVKINFDGMDQTIHREQMLKNEMVTGTPPDMFVLFGGAEIEPYVRSNRLMDLTDFVNSPQLKDQFRDLHLWTFNKHVYGLPIEGNAEPLYINTSIFNELNIPLPESIFDLDEAVDILIQHGYIPFALGNEDRWPAGVFAHYLMDRYADPELINDLVQGKKGSSFQNKDYLKAFQIFEKWAKLGAFGPVPNALSTEKAIGLFTNGKAAMYLNGNWDITLFHNEEAPVDFENKVKVTPFPTLFTGGIPSVAGGYTIGIGLSSDLSDVKKVAAFELMEALYTKEVQTRIVYEALRIPSMLIQFDSEQTGPVFTQIIELMEKSTQSFVPYDNILSPEVKKSFLKVIEEMLNQQITSKQALEQLQSASVQYWDLRRSSTVR